MAERRMFTKKITDSDAFIEMSSSTQALYFHLNQSADDDGFNNQVQIAMMKAHASVDDLKVLMMKNFIIRFENGVIVIKHWRMHNTLRKDRYTPTSFQDELKRLNIKENEAYTLIDSGCQAVANLVPQVRLGKDSIGKDNIPPLPPKGNEFDLFWKAYPKKKAKADAEKAWKSVKGDKHINAILSAISQQKQSPEWSKDGGRFIPHPATWLRGKRWEDATDGKERMTDLDGLF